MNASNNTVKITLIVTDEKPKVIEIQKGTTITTKICKELEGTWVRGKAVENDKN